MFFAVKKRGNFVRLNKEERHLRETFNSNSSITVSDFQFEKDVSKFLVFCLVFDFRFEEFLEKLI